MNKKTLLWTIGILLLMSSCASRKNLIYLQDMVPGKQYLSTNESEVRIQKGDRLEIVVTCKNSELAVPFNSHSGSYRLNSEGNVTSGDIATSQQQRGYRVDEKGYIEFPIIGSIHIEGLTIVQMTDTIKQKIVDGKYIQEPNITADFLNFRIYMLGEVAHPGPINVNERRVNILEAISMAGDLSSKAKTNRVMVLRTVNNNKQVFVNDICSSNIMQSPTFYLQQNDIVYVEPKYRNSSKEDIGFKYASFLLSSVSVISWIMYYFR